MLRSTVIISSTRKMISVSMPRSSLHAMLILLFQKMRSIANIIMWATRPKYMTFEFNATRKSHFTPVQFVRQSTTQPHILISQIQRFNLAFCSTDTLLIPTTVTCSTQRTARLINYMTAISVLD
jgi:hypothetical protein